jgi:exonuclease III
MFETGKAVQVAQEMRTCGLAILGLGETRWTSAGHTRLTTGETILYSGREEEDAQHREGVALMLAKQAQKALMEWEPLGARMIRATFKTSNPGIKLNIVQCYAPTNDSEELIKEEFYHKLERVVGKLRSKDLTILMGDFNPKIGRDNWGCEETMGKHGLGEKNENGELLVDLCAANQLVIGGSLFPHKRIHTATWVSTDHRTENQIDHICITRKFRRSLQDVKVHRGADVASDHHLVIARMKMKLKKFTAANRNRVRYNVDHLKVQEGKNTFCLTISNKFKALQDLEDDLLYEGCPEKNRP